jgi:hypothetical protein
MKKNRQRAWRAGCGLITRSWLGGFCYFPGFDAGSANLHSAGSALWQLYSDRLKIRVESARCTIICVGDIITELRSFATDFTAFCHYLH